MKLELGQMIRFNSIDNFTGAEISAEGKIIGGAKEIKERWPMEFGELESTEEKVYLVEAEGHWGIRSFVVWEEEILKEV